jgi:transcription initiation factor TFIIF subunit alpha
MAPGTANLVLKPACDACGKASDLYGTACRHATVCSSCGKAMARARTLCAVCAAPVTNLIRVTTACLPLPRRAPSSFVVP